MTRFVLLHVTNVTDHVISYGCAWLMLVHQTHCIWWDMGAFNDLFFNHEIESSIKSPF